MDLSLDEILDDIVEDLLQNKKIIVLSNSLTYEELVERLKGIYEDIILSNMSFCDKKDEDISVLALEFENIYIL